MEKPAEELAAYIGRRVRLKCTDGETLDAEIISFFPIEGEIVYKLIKTICEGHSPQKSGGVYLTKTSDVNFFTAL